MAATDTEKEGFHSRKMERDRSPHRVESRGASIAGVAITLLLASFFDIHSRSAGAQDGGPRGRPVHSPATESQREFIRETYRSLTVIDHRLVALAEQVLKVPGYGVRIRDSLANRRLEEKSAEAAYTNAKLTREIAEIAVREYKEGILVQDQATVDGDLRLAESDLRRARELVEYSVRIAAKDGVKLEARLREKGRSAALEAVERKKQALLEYTAPRQTKELESEAAEARFDESVKKAEWDLRKGRLHAVEKAVAEDRPRAVVERRSLILLDRATSIEEQVHAKLDQLISQGNFDEGLQKEIRDLTNELAAAVVAAESARAAEDLDDLQPRIRAAARRQGTGGPN
jgi:hypothetical protein